MSQTITSTMSKLIGQVHALDVTKDGAMLGTIAVGVDELDLDSANRTVYVGGGNCRDESRLTN
jgi:hypothetical protein